VAGPAPSALTHAVWTHLQGLLDGDPSQARLEAALRQLAKWRSGLIGNTIAAQAGTTVASGPFAGLVYPGPASEGGYAPRLLGAYETTLHPVIETIAARPYARLIDIGSAEGYYAVGMARRMPQTEIWARDASPRARDLCAALARNNGMSDRVIIGAEITHSDLAVCALAPTAIICDIEGAEDALLDPIAAPGLCAADILVEVHDLMNPRLSDRIAARFAGTHRITRLPRRIDPDALPALTAGWSDLDRLLALWEWRGGDTPWLWIDRWPEGAVTSPA
jgi:hypothetical protein